MEIKFQAGSPPQGWDNLIKSAGTEGGFFQSTTWAHIIQRVDQALPLFFTVLQGGKATASLLAFHKSPWDRNTMQPAGGWRARISGLQNGWLEWQDGPVIHDQEGGAASLELLLESLADFARQKRLRVIKSSGFAHTSAFAQTSEACQSFLRHGYTSSKWATFLIDLTLPEETLWQALERKSARQAVNKARRDGVSVVQLHDLDSIHRDFYEPLAGVRELAGIHLNPFSVLQAQFEEDHTGHYSYFIARGPAGNTLAVQGCFIFNGVATNITRGTMPEAVQAHIPAQELLVWEMIRYAKNRGCHTYDEAGSNPDPQTPKEAGIRNFQEKWGGQYIEFNRFEYRRDTWLRSAWKHLSALGKPKPQHPKEEIHAA